MSTEIKQCGGASEESASEKLCVVADEFDASNPEAVVDRLIKMKYAVYAQACSDRNKLMYFDAETLFGKTCRVHRFPTEDEFRAIVTADDKAQIEKAFAGTETIVEFFDCQTK